MLKNLKTNLKSLKFGNDRIGGGNSNQPYITSPIPEGGSSLNSYDDFIIRGGIKSITNSKDDVIRLGKFMTDLKSPKGIFFVAKQEILSRTAVRTQVGGLLNEGIYSPIGTLLQAGSNAFGVHLPKQGLNPFATPRTYNSVVKNFQPSEDNRLVQLSEGKLSTPTSVLTYTGGPGSILGIGRTNIRFSDQRTGINNFQYNSPYFVGKQPKPDTIKDYKQPFGVSKKYNELIPNPGDRINLDILNQFNNFNSNVLNISVYNSGSTFPDNNISITSFNGAKTLDQTQINELASINFDRNTTTFSPKTFDFRASLRKDIKNSTIVVDSPSYNTSENKTVEGRINAGDPGNRSGKNLVSYTAGSGIGPIDKINSLPIYRSKSVDVTKPVNDLVKFRIACIDNINPAFKTFIHFRAFLNTISDSYNADWSTVKYLGRGENFYTYNGFARQLSLSWNVVAQSKEELIPMYQKLNYLASTLTPDYSPNGFMKGNLVQLTIGGYLYEQPGIISNLVYELDDQTPWEIGINDKGGNDPSVKELPHIIRVSGFNFFPIHNFRPQKQGLSFGKNKISYGPERYIALSNGENNNYDD